MTFDSVFAELQKKFPKGVTGREDTKPDPAIKVEPESIHAVLLYMRDALGFETLGCISGVDLPSQKQLAVAYHPTSYQHKLIVCLKLYLPRGGNPSVPTVSDIFKGANWLERETYDMFGVKFDGHPDLRRILLPDDWQGHPLLKDYSTPDYYNGMPVPLYFDEGSETTEGHA